MINASYERSTIGYLSNSCAFWTSDSWKWLKYSLENMWVGVSVICNFVLCDDIKVHFNSRNVQHCIFTSRFRHWWCGTCSCGCCYSSEVTRTSGNYADWASWHIALLRRNPRWTAFCYSCRWLVAQVSVWSLSSAMCLSPHDSRSTVLGIFQWNSLRRRLLWSDLSMHSSGAMFPSAHKGIYLIQLFIILSLQCLVGSNGHMSIAEYLPKNRRQLTESPTVVYHNC